MRKINLKPLIVALIFLTLFASSIVLFFVIRKRTQTPTNTEKIAIENASSQVANYFEYLDFQNENYATPEDSETKNIDDAAKYLSFAVIYLRDEQNKTRPTFREVEQLIAKHFTTPNFDDDTIINACPSAIFSLNQIFCDAETRTFTSERTQDLRTIAATPIIKYLPQSYTRHGDEFEITYNRYSFATPYDILNRLVDAHADGAADAKSYLVGRTPSSTIKNAITQELANNLGKNDGSITVTYLTSDGNIRIKDFRKN